MIVNDFGDHYNLVTNNCRVVTSKVAKFITNNKYREEQRDRDMRNVLKGLQRVYALGRAAFTGM